MIFGTGFAPYTGGPMNYLVNRTWQLEQALDTEAGKREESRYR